MMDRMMLQKTKEFHYSPPTYILWWGCNTGNVKDQRATFSIFMYLTQTSQNALLLGTS